jgi:hypothetical protein
LILNEKIRRDGTSSDPMQFFDLFIDVSEACHNELSSPLNLSHKVMVAGPIVLPTSTRVGSICNSNEVRRLISATIAPPTGSKMSTLRSKTRPPALMIDLELWGRRRRD